jgi:hypothetical protein
VRRGWRSISQLTKAFDPQVVAVTDLMVAYRPPYASIHVNLLYRQVDGRITANPLHAKLVVDVSNLQGYPTHLRCQMANHTVSNMES